MVRLVSLSGECLASAAKPAQAVRLLLDAGWKSWRFICNGAELTVDEVCQLPADSTVQAVKQTVGELST